MGLRQQAHRDAQRLVHPLHILRRDASGPLPQAAFVQRADLLGQDDAVFGQAAPVRPHPDMGRQAVFVLPGGDGGRDHSGAVPVADLILYDKYRPYPALFAAHHRAEIRIKNFASVYLHGPALLL